MFNPQSHLQALQKICLADHIREMADLIHVDAIQQLKVALLGSPAVEMIDLLSSGVSQSRTVTVTWTAQPHLCTYTSTTPAPPPASVPVVGVSEFSLMSSLMRKFQQPCQKPWLLMFLHQF